MLMAGDTALLTVTDLPAGFTVDTSPDSASTPSGCEELDALEQQGGSELEARFTKGSYGPFVSETLKQGPSEAAMHDALVTSAVPCRSAAPSPPRPTMTARSP
jgi:hypothetical protein